MTLNEIGNLIDSGAQAFLLDKNKDFLYSYDPDEFVKFINCNDSNNARHYLKNIPIIKIIPDVTLNEGAPIILIVLDTVYRNDL